MVDHHNPPTYPALPYRFAAMVQPFGIYENGRRLFSPQLRR